MKDIDCMHMYLQLSMITHMSPHPRDSMKDIDCMHIYLQLSMITHMSTSSKRLNERHRFHAYLSTTVDDRS